MQALESKRFALMMKEMLSKAHILNENDKRQPVLNAYVEEQSVDLHLFGSDELSFESRHRLCYSFA